MELKTIDRSALKDLPEGKLIELFKQFVGQSLNFVPSSIDSVMGVPSTAQFSQIVQFLDSEHGTTEDDWFVVSILASDNLISRSIRAWHPNVLDQMASLFPGSPLQLNHDWDDAEQNIGFIYSARKQNLPLPQEALTDPIRGALNRSIADSIGFQALILDCAIPASDTETIDRIKKRKYDCISTGGYMAKMRFICPDCSRQKNREVTFTERDKNGDYVCPHLIPTQWDQMYDMEEDDDDDRMKPASYLILDGVFDAIEVSYVVAGNLPLARTIRR